MTANFAMCGAKAASPAFMISSPLCNPCVGSDYLGGDVYRRDYIFQSNLSSLHLKARHLRKTRAEDRSRDNGYDQKREQDA